MRHWCPLVLVLLLAGFLSLDAAPSRAQGTSTVDEPLRVAVANGVDAIRQENQQQARQLLESALLDTLSYVSDEHGSGAYWLGRAYAESDQMDRALGVWRSGLLSLLAHDRFSVRLADAFVHNVCVQQKQSDYALAADAYREMLRRSGEMTHGEEERERLAQRLRQLALVLPEDVRRRARLPESDTAITAETIPTVRGDELLVWWRSEDPLPATRSNEQLYEHLQRVAHALDEYGHPAAVYGFDERGEIYVRLGPPDHDVSVNFSDSRMTDLIYEQEVGVDVNFSDFPANEFWSYGNVDRRLYYVFVQEETNGPFTIGTVEDLLPRTLRAAYGSSRRAQQRSVYALSILRSIYRTYSPFHPNMARRHDEVANYLQYVRTGGLEQFNNNERPPTTFLNSTLKRDDNRDAVASRRRRERAPRQLSTTKRNYDQLSLAVRTARFLTDDGLTRTEVYWAPEAGAFFLEEEQREPLEEEGYGSFNDFLVRFTATQEEPAYQDRVINRENYRVTDVGDETSTIPAQTFSTQRGDSTLYHLSLQWDQYLIDTGEQSVGPKVQVATERHDSLRALDDGPKTLEISDLRPVVLSEGEAPVEENTLPYPFEEVSIETPLALYFEIYHLALGPDDRTEYTVDYRVEGRADRGKIAELFLGQERRETVVSSTYEGTERTVRELIRLDVEDWDLETETTATLSVRVTDETTGQQVERSIQFQLMPSE